VSGPDRSVSHHDVSPHCSPTLRSVQLRLKKRVMYGQSRSGNSCIKSRNQTTGTGTEAVTQCDHCLAECQQQRSRDHRKALRSNIVRFSTKKNRSGSEGTLGEVEGSTTEEGSVTIAPWVNGFSLGRSANQASAVKTRLTESRFRASASDDPAVDGISDRQANQPRGRRMSLRRLQRSGRTLRA
jgi:hypothetical protein